MPPRLTYPGVYVEEKSSGVKTITGVATSTTLFVGMARKGEVGRPTAIRGIDQFEQIFGDDAAYGEMVPQIRQFFLNGGADTIVVRIAANDAAPASVTLRSSGGGKRTGTHSKKRRHLRQRNPRYRRLQHPHSRVDLQHRTVSPLG